MPRGRTHPVLQAASSDENIAFRGLAQTIRMLNPADGTDRLHTTYIVRQATFRRPLGLDPRHFRTSLAHHRVLMKKPVLLNFTLVARSQGLAARTESLATTSTPHQVRMLDRLGRDLYRTRAPHGVLKRSSK